MKIKKVSVSDIRKIKAGETKVFHVPNVKDIRTAQATAYKLNRFEPELGVTFSLETDYDNLSITITAIKNQ